MTLSRLTGDPIRPRVRSRMATHMATAPREPARHSISGDLKRQASPVEPPQQGAKLMTFRKRAASFCGRFGLEVPILLAPMAGASFPKLSIAVAKAGGMGACGVLMMTPEEIVAWSAEVRRASNGIFQLNNWIPDPAPRRDLDHERKLRGFLAAFGPAPGDFVTEAHTPDFEGQCQAMLDVAPPAVSSVMGLFSPSYVARLHERGVSWFAVVSTVSEAKRAEEAGADVIVAQGMEAGGHRAAFAADRAEAELVGLISLLPAVVDAVTVPVVATGGIADARGVAAAFALGASAVQMGTQFLRADEAGVHPAWSAALARAAPEDTRVSRVFSGRPGRSLATAYVRAATAPDAPSPAPYPVQRVLTANMRADALAQGDVERMQAWAGQSSGLASGGRAEEMIDRVWSGALELLQ